VTGVGSECYSAKPKARHLRHRASRGYICWRAGPCGPIDSPPGLHVYAAQRHKMATDTPSVPTLVRAAGANVPKAVHVPVARLPKPHRGQAVAGGGHRFGSNGLAEQLAGRRPQMASKAYRQLAQLRRAAHRGRLHRRVPRLRKGRSSRSGCQGAQLKGTRLGTATMQSQKRAPLPASGGPVPPGRGPREIPR